MKRSFMALAALLVFASPTLAQMGGVRGKVLDDQGKPLEGVAVKMEFQGGMPIVFESKTNKKGEYMQIGMRSGMWKFTGVKEPFQTVVVPVRVPAGDATALPDVKMMSAAAARAAAGDDGISKAFGDAVAKLQAGDHDGAIAAFDALLVKNPSVSEAHYNKAFAQFQKKDYAAAEATLKRVLELKADYGDAKVLLSNVYTEQGFKDKALEVMASGAGTADPKQLFNLGLALLNSGKNEEANAAFAKAEIADPKHAEVQYYLATGALNAGKTDECISRLEKYLTLGPKSDQNKATAIALLAALKK